MLWRIYASQQYTLYIYVWVRVYIPALTHTNSITHIYIHQHLHCTTYSVRRILYIVQCTCTSYTYYAWVYVCVNHITSYNIQHTVCDAHVQCTKHTYMLWYVVHHSMYVCLVSLTPNKYTYTVYIRIWRILKIVV